MSIQNIIVFILECCATALVCYAIYREQDLIKFERKIARYIKAFFKALYYTIKERGRNYANARKCAKSITTFAE